MCLRGAPVCAHDVWFGAVKGWGEVSCLNMWFAAVGRVQPRLQLHVRNSGGGM